MRPATDPPPARTELDGLRASALEAVRRYAEAALEPERFVPGSSRVAVAAKVLDPADLVSATDAVLDASFTEGRFADEFRAGLARAVEREHAVLVGSGSQANLLAVAAATSHLHARPLQPGDEVITAAIGFPTTVTPLYQYGLVPVYVDVEPDTYNPSLAAIADAIGPRTRAVVLAHTLGNPFDGPGVEALCREHGLVLIEDACDALGSRIAGRQAGTFGAAATYSFYPAHHMTTGEGERSRATTPRGCGRSARCASGGATAGARPAATASAGAASRGASATCRPATTTSTSSRTPASTSRSPTCRRRSASRSWPSSRSSAAAGARMPPTWPMRSRRWRTGSCCRAACPAPTRPGSASR